MIANAIVGVVQSIQTGKVAMAQARYNAALLEGKAKWIDFQKEITGRQYDRARNRFISKSINTIAGQGLQASGSPMAVLLDSVTQINIDKAISLSNLEQEKQYTKMEAERQLVEGRMSKSNATTNAFSHVLKGVSDYGLYYNKGK